MSDNSHGSDPAERPEMISRVPWGSSQPSSPASPSTQALSPVPAGDEDEGTRRVTRGAPAGQSEPARPAPSGQPHSESSTPTPTSASSAPQPPAARPSPLGSPQPHRVPGPGQFPGQGAQQHAGPGQVPNGYPQPGPAQGPGPYGPPSGQTSFAPPQRPGAGGPGPAAQPQQPRSEQSGPPAPGGQGAPALGGVAVPQPSRAADHGGYPPRYGVDDLIHQLNPEVQQKSRKGWRSRLGLKPSQRELAELRDDESVRMPFARPVTIMVANPKGGVGKTPTTLMLAAAMGVARGGGVIAWDNNELRGTMPDRSLSPHRRTVRDLLAESDFLSKPTAQFTDLSYYFNHQTTGKFHTLGSAQTSGHVISREDFERIHNILSRFFQVIIIDTGNNEASPNWQAAAEEADCLVVPTKWRKDSLIPAARMLETLQELNSDLLNRTVVVATNGPADSQQTVRLSGAEFFGSYPIVEIPTDPHIAEGGVIDYLRLQEQTRRASVALAAEVARAIEPVAGLSQVRGAASPPRRSV
ncbi:MinD/ParA family ATP-binding protein [Auraticoccus monumenti]|uniref:MinD-like ATPase involved in chromosome partitioning or flagellar assembly n=1 Tax=Auraticoccus monumenti TaxID=675864 RepID=A0A1G6VA54_9ACTN|nr:hypothetical protein [Auraticoccus monumenti]SDD50448.1 MinD-like ATPase involved in chromosome partitioning or flagellar assembly [Auraticoccus monumenti]